MGDSIVHRCYILLEKNKTKKERMARVFIAPSARKFREDRLSISLNDRKKDTRPFDADYIYLGKIGIFCATSSDILIVLLIW